jgi:peptidoglycan/xylan/chitin deacetylase (PgdA/CDA1 family)
MVGVSFGRLAPRRLLRKAVLTSLGALGLPERLAARARARGEIIVLNLHRVSPHPNPFWTPLHPRRFDELLAFVKTRFRVTTFGELEHEPSGPKPAEPRSPLVLSFDDGYHDFLEYAVPLLEKHRLRANQNVIGACVLSGRPPWNVELVDFLNQCPPPLLRELRVPGLNAPPPGDDDASKTAYGLALSRHLKTRPCAERTALVEELFAFARRANYTPTRVMNLDEVREIARRHEIGSHSYSHESMGLEPPEFFESDLDEAERFHREKLGTPLSIYAFPNGSYRREQVDLLFERGVRHVLLVDETTARDARLVPRVTFHADSRAEVHLRAVAFLSQLRDLTGRAARGRS